jgi:hypothetical protein
MHVNNCLFPLGRSPFNSYLNVFFYIDAVSFGDPDPEGSVCSWAPRIRVRIR